MPPPRLRVGLDAHMVGAAETGNETYVRGLLEGLARMDDVPELVVYAARGATGVAAPRGGAVRRLWATNPLVRLGAELPLRTARDHLDVLHVTYAGPPWCAARLVVAVHDVCFLSHPEWFSPRDRAVLTAGVRRSSRQAARILTISEVARADIVAHYGLDTGRVVAIPLAPGPAARPVPEAAAVAALTGLGIDARCPYVLAVGTRQPRKNLARLVMAFSRLRAAGSFDGDLVIAGPAGYGHRDLDAAPGVHLTGYVDDASLAALYQRSHAFVMPSLYEAFGIPVVEAMSHGIPVACSTGGALPEVCDGAALMFDPADVEAIAAGLLTVVSDSAARDGLSRRGRRRAAGLDWETTARATVAAYRDAAAS